jgi:hypothetical protein
VVTVAFALSAAPARADDPVATARAQARAAEHDVRALQARLQAADTSYGNALDGLANAVTSQVQAERIADDATQRAEVGPTCWTSPSPTARWPRRRAATTSCDWSNGTAGP